MLRFAPASIVRRACLILSLVSLSAGALFCRAEERAADEPTAEATAIDPEAIKNLKAAYPAAAAGKTRHVILLPHKERGAEGDVKVEIVAGRTIDTDGVNTVRFGGGAPGTRHSRLGLFLLRGRCPRGSALDPDRPRARHADREGLRRRAADARALQQPPAAGRLRPGGDGDPLAAVASRRRSGAC